MQFEKIKARCVVYHSVYICHISSIEYLDNPSWPNQLSMHGVQLTSTPCGMQIVPVKKNEKFNKNK